MKLYLVRHGQSTGNVGEQLMGQSDHPLTPLGEAQAAAAAARLAPFGPMPVYHSDLPRAAATARYIVDSWLADASARAGEAPGPAGVAGPAPAASAPAGADGPASSAQAAPAPSALLLFSDPRLREISLGDYEGASWARFEADTELMAAFERDPYGTAVPGGESLAHLVERVVAALRAILSAHGVTDAHELSTEAVATSDASALATGFHLPPQGAAACIVAHDGPIRAILNHYLGVPPEKWWTLSTTHGGVSLLEFSGGWVNVRYVNAAEHLAGLEPDVYVPSMDDPGVDAGDDAASPSG